MDTKDAYIAKLKAQLDEWKAEIAQFEARARTAQADKQIAYSEHIAELRQRHNDAQQQLTRLQQATGEGWEEIKRGVEDAWSHLASAFSNARDRLRESKAA